MNETIIKSNRIFIPGFWKAENVTASQGTGIPMIVPGIPFATWAFPRSAALTSVGLRLTEAITAGFLRLVVTKNGTETAKLLDLTSSHGTKYLWELSASNLVGNKGDELGFNWGSNAAFAPSGSIDLVVYAEIQWVE